MYWTDIHTPHDAEPDALASAVANAFGVAASQVAIVPRATPEAIAAWRRPGLFGLVQVERREAEGPDDLFPITLAISIRVERPNVDQLEVLQTIARGIDMPVVSSIDHDGPDAWRLVRPNGTSDVVFLDDDENIVLGEADRALLKASHHVAA